MNSIKKGYLPYLIGEVACCAAEVVLFFFALFSDSPFTLIVSILAIAATGVGVMYVYKKSRVKGSPRGITERDAKRADTSQNATKKKKTVRAAYPLAILSLILLASPNIGIVDVLPDFIACFVLARLLSPGTERAPYFMEAKKALVRLGWLNVGKLFGLMLIGYSRMQNAFGNDTSVMVVTVFSVAELVLCVSATTAIFNALFGLGERTDMKATITTRGRISADALPLITYAFFGAKTILGAIPSFFLLTRVSDDGIISTVAKGYAPALVITTFIVLACGIAWCVIMIKYLNSIHKEGQFYNSIFVLSGAENEERIVRHSKTARIKSALTLFFAASVLLIDVKFDNTGEINLLPDLIFGAVLIIAICRLRPFVQKRVLPLLLAGGAYLCATASTYVAESHFLYRYGYDDLLMEGAAQSQYNTVEILSVVETCALIVLAVLVGRMLICFAYENTAIPPSDERYSRADADFHKALKHRIVFFTALVIAVGVAKCINVFAHGYATLQLNLAGTSTVMNAIPWMSALTTAITVLLIGFSYYLFTLLKEEVDMKYGREGEL